MKTRNFTMCALLAAGALCMTSCLSDGEDTIVIAGQEVNPLGIPSDSEAEEAPEIDYPTVNLPGMATTMAVKDGWAYMDVTMNGIWNDQEGDWLTLYGTGSPKQNTWLSVDGKPKGIDIYNNSESNDRVIPTDIVFLVDNSGSMSEEADAIAASIISWVEGLEYSGISIRVGCVGYGSWYQGVDGAINLTTVQNLKAYLDRSTGTDRTVGFGGTDADYLSNLASAEKYNYGRDWDCTECGMVAWHYANDNFNFRNNSNRVYVNFTDESNQPQGLSQFSVEYLNPAYNENVASYGTIHTVYSSSPDYYETSSDEYPWRMSEYTGGTVIYADSSFYGITLNDLPVTGAIANSYVIRFTNIDDCMDGLPHVVKITVRSTDGAVQGEKSFRTIFQEGTYEE